MIASFNDEKGNIIDFYEMLNIPYEAEKADIRSAFCNLVKMYHPDISGRNSDDDRKKVDIIIKGYNVLIDDNLRDDYDKQLFNKRRYNQDGYIFLPKTRIKYSISLKDLLMTRLLNKDIKRKDRIYNFGQDVEIFITPRESRRGVIAFVELPSRTPCPLCYGEDKYCNVCQGVGRIHSSSSLEVKVPPGASNGTTIDVDLIKVRPDRFTHFSMRNLRIKISLIGSNNQPASG